MTKNQNVEIFVIIDPLLHEFLWIEKKIVTSFLNK